MRSIVFLIAVICLVNGQSRDQSSFSNPAVNPFVNPSFASNVDQLPTNQPTQSTGGPFTRIINWFKRPSKPNSNVASSTSNEFSNTLPNGSTDRMISNAISDRLLEESREQLSYAGSPFVPQEKLVDQHETSASEKPEHVLSNNRIGYGKSVANTATDTIPLTEALRIVNTSNLSDCVARVICELSCNANAYGAQGRVVFRNLIKLQFDQSIKSDDAKFFRQAAAKGRQIVQGKRECKECFSIYSSCRSSSEDLVAVSSMFKL